MTDTPTIQARHNEDGTLDEVIARGVDVHIEQLDSGVWWVGLQSPDGRVDHITFPTKRGAAISGRLDANLG